MQQTPLDRLLELIKVPSRSGHERVMIEYIISILNELKIPHHVDEKGNIYRFLKNTPLLSAHMDTVGNTTAQSLLQYVRYWGDDNGKINGIGNIGADDKCGVWIILETLINKEFRDKVSFIFSVEEEVGGSNGIDFVVKNNKKKISSLPYFIVVDRRNASDFVCTKNDYGTQEFEDAALKLIGKDTEFKYESSIGSRSDANELSNHISGVNMSVGYYSPHNEDEHIMYQDVVNALGATHTLIANLKGSFKKPAKRAITPYKFPKYSYYGNTTSASNALEVCSRCKTPSVVDKITKLCYTCQLKEEEREYEICQMCKKWNYVDATGLCRECTDIGDEDNLLMGDVIEQGKVKCDMCESNVLKREAIKTKDRTLCADCFDNSSECPNCFSRIFIDEIETFMNEEDKEIGLCPMCHEQIDVDAILSEITPAGVYGYTDDHYSDYI